MTDSFAKALARRDEQTPVVDPDTGEILSLPDADHAYLVDVFLKLQEYERRLIDWRRAVEDELVRRHDDKGLTPEFVGNHTIEVQEGWTRVWDVDDLKATVQDLVARGVVSLQDVSGLIETSEKVNGRKAQDLLNRVSGDALTELRRCFTWSQKGRARVKVTQVTELNR